MWHYNIIRRTLFCSATAALLAAAAASQAFAADRQIPGATFTKIQDLNPESKPLNRPVRCKWAVVVGVGKFKDRRLNNDQSVDKAAGKFYSYLTDPKGGRLQSDQVRLLRNEEATGQNILNAIGPRWLGSVAQEDDLVIVYIATQGFPTTDGNSWLCTYNCALDNIYGTCLSMPALMQTLKSSVKSDRVVLILDSSYSGAADMAGARELKSSYGLDLNKVLPGRGYIMLCSAKTDEAARGSRFSDNLIAALRKKEGLIDLSDAFEQARTATSQDAAAAGARQTPVLKADWTGARLSLGVPPLEKAGPIPQSVRNFLGAEAHYLQASKLMAAGNLDAAITEYEAAVATDTSYSDALADYAVALALKGRWQEAEHHLQHAVELKPDDALYRVNHARTLDALGQQDQCRRELEKAYNLNPKDRVVLCALADKCIASGDISSAIGLLQDALEMYPDMAALHDRIGFAYCAAGNLETAGKHIEQAVTIDPALASARLNLGSLLAAKGNYKEAVERYRQAIKLAPDNADAHLLLSKALEKLADVVGARDALMKFIELLPPGDSRRLSAQAHLDAMQSSAP